VTEPLRLTVNGVESELEASPDTPLLYALRNDLGLKGTRFGCGSGQCGACFVLIDGHPAHTAKLVDCYLETMEGRLELHRLPSYAPDLNPDEFVWAHMKKNGVSKKPLKQNESLLKRVQKDLVSIKDNRALVRSFFCAESVLYAKD